jgi:hypothetical protein
MMKSWHSYPKVYNVGHPAIKELFNEPVLVQEKIDGSQFSFGKTPEGQVLVRSRGRVFPVDGPDDMFTLACERVLAVSDKLIPGHTYRGEYLRKPKHNTLCYDRVPTNNIMIFDITCSEHTYLPDIEVSCYAQDLGFEYVGSNCLKVNTLEEMKALMDLPSKLGGKREGLVFKNYGRFTKDGHAMMGKYVSEEFKEVHKGEWKESNPTQGDIIQRLQDTYCTPARWLKAEQHLRDAGKLSGEPKDIGLLIKEAKKDFSEEVKAEAMEDLWRWAREKLLDQCIRGLPEWYKEKLAKEQFE